MSLDPEVLRLLEGYRVTITVPVWWGDQDAFGHVNNTIPLRWFESARIDYMGRVGLSDMMASHRIGPILASIAVDYRHQTHYPDTVIVGARVTKLGRTSVSMEHLAVSLRHGAVVVHGRSTLVVFDYANNRPEPIPSPIREAIEALEACALS